MVNLVTSCILSFLLFTAAAQAPSQQEVEAQCYQGLEGLLNMVSNLGAGLKNKADLQSIGQQMRGYLMMFPSVMMQCATVLEYDLSTPVYGYGPNFNNIVDCPSGYLEFLDQMKRIWKAYQNNSIEQVRLTTSKLGPLTEAVTQVCVSPSP